MKYITIERCFDCPKYQYGFNGGRCGLSQKEIRFIDVKKIPDWCELADDSELFFFKHPINNIKLNPTSCLHCEFLHKIFLESPDSTERDYFLMTEVFVYLHGGDVCNYSTELNKKQL